MRRPVVIGSGPNGLSAAFYLAKAGRRPIVLERSDVVGGGAINAEIHPGFHAPVFSHEVLLHATIERDMNLAAHGLRWLDCPVDVCAPARDGRPLVIYSSAARTAEAMRTMHPRDADTWPRFRDAMSRTARVIAPLLASTPPSIAPGLREIWELLATGRRFRSLGSHDARSLLRWLPMPVFDFVHEWFQDDRLRALVAAPSLSGTMLGPRSAGSILPGTGSRP
jgi:phytoene dehydrogenase-like protein